MKRIRVTVATVVAVGALALPTAAAYAGARPDAHIGGAWTERQVQALLQHNPGSQRIGANAVALKQGVMRMSRSPWNFGGDPTI